MSEVRVMDAVAALFAVTAVWAGLSSLYNMAAGFVLVFGLVLAARSIFSGASARRLVPRRPEARRLSGPVSALVTRVESAKRGSFFSQKEIADILTSAAGERTRLQMEREILEPPREGKRLKGSRYVAGLEHSIRVMDDD